MTYDVAIIGAGPGGYVAALKAAQCGLKVALIEKRELGGVCLNRGCIPTKAMLASVHLWQKIKEAKSYGLNVTEATVNLADVIQRQQKIVLKMRKGLEQLLRSHASIDIYQGTATFKSAETLLIEAKEPAEIIFKNAVIATGSEASDLGSIKADHSLIINSDDALLLQELPQTMVIVGGGAIGVEWARIYSAFGVQVTLVELLDRLLPTCDEEISATAMKLLKRNKVVFKLATRVESIQKVADHASVVLSNGEKVQAEKVLLAVGRKPHSDIAGLADIGVKLKNNHIEIDDRMRTSLPHIYAIGDVVGKLQLAHVASHEGVIAIENILEQPTAKINYTHVPFCIYGDPEIAAVGFTEMQAREVGIDVEVNKFFFAANGKALAESETAGFIKTVINIESGKIIGTHIIGPAASDIIHQGVIAVKHGLTKKEFADTIYAHPTLSETFHESITGLHLPGKPEKRL
jgi:dihydrolipoamide dehydrogenase